MKNIVTMIAAFAIMAAVCGCEKVEETSEEAMRKTTELANSAAQKATELGNAAARKAGQLVGAGSSHFFKGLGEGIEEASAEFKSELEKRLSE